jgi:Fe-S cluster assembly iron-binding protein IscA
MLRLTDDAATAVADIAGDGVLRLIAHESDEGVEIETVVADEPEDGDEVVESGAARVCLDATAAEVLADQVLDVHPHGDHVHFVFAPQDEA